LIEFIRINKSYKDKQIFSNFNLLIKDNEFVLIKGDSGQGKTTLLNLLGLLDKPDSGNIIIEGKSYKELNLKEMRRYVFSYVFQNYGLIDEETVEKNLLVPLMYRKDIDKKKEIKIALEKVGLCGYEKKKIYELSGGEQQRVAISRLLMKESKYIFADEPTGNLDDKNSALVYNLLKKLHEEGRTVIVATHDEIFNSNLPTVINLNEKDIVKNEEIVTKDKEVI
jgi:putative ABC transport system ATP-binding protein